ncbi:MAG: Rrf2 family transcriptional regulator, partial [Gammaproteobacteria bacterium]|nr:Rrf2 family transcriptional regulator [Gammaproteobacteria bacterium]
MRKDSRLSRMLHVLIHMNQLDAPATSEKIASMLNTNPVVVRRTMAGLRDKGYVTSVKGHGGGWSLAMALSDITLLDIHNAL